MKKGQGSVSESKSSQNQSSLNDNHIRNLEAQKSVPGGVANTLSTRESVLTGVGVGVGVSSAIMGMN